MASLFPLGSEGPVLPRFKTLLVKGPYHASAPIHLSVSHLSEAENNSVLFITPSRKSLKSALISFNDNWVTKNATTGHVASLLSRVSMFYPPSPAHLCMLLSLFQLPDASLGRANPKTIIATIPSLLVIHELSEYFRDDEARGSDK
ncbi:hypothetical protein BDQ12DRAFT_718385 [Crucibulum laeve]|uniref:Uncharacterized protein n=1 Tax=Crucibulum laeve TaxID=68775 RepID=A0A5C3MCS7_9AGAR|nr:hypothetical protein BDQ12DRAFT_718385 [Crucibulum laeve]